MGWCGQRSLLLDTSLHICASKVEYWGDNVDIENKISTTRMCRYYEVKQYQINSRLYGIFILRFHACSVTQGVTSSFGNVAAVCTKQCGHKHYHCLQNTDRWATVIDLPSITGTLIYLLLQPRQGKYRQRGVAWPTGQGCAAQQHSDAHSWITARKIGMVQVWKWLEASTRPHAAHEQVCLYMHRENTW